MKNVLKVLGVLFLLYIIAKGCGGLSDDTQTQSTTPTADANSFSNNDSDVEKNKPTETFTPKIWDYFESTDKMTSKPVKYATIDANELLTFKFPYEGGSTATLVLRKKNGVNDAYIKVSKGQFKSNFDGTNSRVRFDENKASTYSMGESSDGSSDILFFNNANRLISGLKKAKTMKLEIEFYDEGIRVIEFNVTGLNWR